MIREYKKHNVIDTFGENGLVYEASKNDKKYYLYEFQQYGEADVYNFKVLNKIMSTHILAVYQQFVEEDVHYIITDYAEKDLLKLQTDQPNGVFPLPVALDYFAKVILALEQFHECKLVYRNIRPEVIKLRGDEVFFFDFTLSQFCKRKQRMFDVVGCQSFLAPQFFSQDGYGFQIDVWAAGVLLFFMLTHQYPFKFKDKSQKATQQQFKGLAQCGFSFQKRLESCKNPGFIKGNKILEDFFRKIFEYDYSSRITIKKIKDHKLMIGYFPQKIDLDILQAIGEQGSILQSVFLTKFLDLKQYKISTQIQREQLILDFVERCSESLMLDCAEYIPEKIRNRAQFAILKVAMIKINYLIDLCYGRRKPEFSFDEGEFQIIKSNSAFKKMQQNLERKYKIIFMLYKSSFMQLQVTNQDNFFNDQVPEDFNEIKISYRLALSEMFEAVKNVMQKNKSNKLLLRKLTEVMVRMVIMHLINRIFEAEDFSKNFSLYIAWNKGEGIQNLDQWIHAERQINLKHFIKQTTKNYL